MKKATVNRSDYVVGKRSIRYKGKLKIKTRPAWKKGSPLSTTGKYKLEGNRSKKR